MKIEKGDICYPYGVREIEWEVKNVEPLFWVVCNIPHKEPCRINVSRKEWEQAVKGILYRKKENKWISELLK